MAFIYEKVKEEDWELYNSISPRLKAGKHTRWVVDKERNIFFFWTGGEAREYIDEYFLSWNNFKIYIYIETKMYKESTGGQKAHICIKRISMPPILNNYDDRVNEIVDTIQEILQMMYRSKIIFEEIVTPSFRKGDN